HVVHDAPRAGLRWLSLGSSSTSVSLTFWRITRPTADRALLQLSRLSGSSGMTMVMVLCANAAPGAISARVTSAAADTAVVPSWRKLIRNMAILSSFCCALLELTSCPRGIYQALLCVAGYASVESLPDGDGLWPPDRA